MFKGLKVVLIITLVLMLFGVGCNYNAMVEKGEEVDAQWQQVETQYQRRMDLIPNLVSTVKGYASHESDTYTAVTEARAKVGNITVDKSILEDPELFAKYQEAQNNLSSALSRLIAVSENYPELKANENFLSLQDELEGTENRIATERQRFNKLVKEYNVLIKRFPGNLFAKMYGFKEKEYFAAAAGAEKAPVVQF
jgi:LemA protein